MRAPPRPPQAAWPLAPLLRTYVEAGVPGPEALEALPELGPRVRAVRAAHRRLRTPDWLHATGDDEWRAALTDFYEAVVPLPLHRAALLRRAALVRHGVGHLARCPDLPAAKLDRCLAPDGPYFVPGLGPAFWSAWLQAVDPLRCPAWLPSTEAGLRRLGLLGGRRALASSPTAGRPGTVYAAVLQVYHRLRELDDSLTALHLDHFLSLVATMRGRDLWTSGPAAPVLPALVRQERSRLPLRRRLRERGAALADARARLEAALAGSDGAGLAAALTASDPAGSARAPLDREAAGGLLEWVGRLWRADDPGPVLEAFWRAAPVPGAGLWLPAAVLHLRDPQAWPTWDEPSRQGFAALADRPPPAPPAEGYRLFREGVAGLRDRLRLHPLEVSALLAAVGRAAGDDEPPPRPGGVFGGFCADTFRFLDELARHNRRDWMARQRDRYAFAVRQPLGELAQALVDRYVEPVLRRAHGWDLETDIRGGRALSRITKNDYGRTVPYHAALWVTFYRRPFGGKRDDVQFFVRLDAAGLCYGVHLGRTARQAGRLFRRNVQEHAEALHRALHATGALAACSFGHAEDLSDGRPLTAAGDLRAWAGGKALLAAKRLPPDAPLLTRDELVGDVLLTFDRLLPAYACAVEADPLPALERRAGPPADAGYGPAEFRRDTHLPAGWLPHALELLQLKRQVVLQGVPGTGKTHVARCLARLLTGDRAEAVRLVQFHPAYNYEEFVEGIKARTVEVDGRHDVTYPVEDGLLCAFATQAAREPARPHVLVIDEINRGNLPRIFGELLFLLEYRDQQVVLPYSQRGFQLPANLHLIGTMNAADRSVALVDQALRRRFSFLEMPPDAGVLASWLEAHPPAGDAEAAIKRVVGLFEALNDRLRAELGPTFQVGHSYFMVPDLTEERLRAVWAHQVWPLLEEYFAGQPARLAPFSLERLLGGKRKASRSEPASR